MGESGAPESLDGLLSGLDGVEGSVLSRPKSLRTMKRTDMKQVSNVKKETATSPETEQRQGPATASYLEQRQATVAFEDTVHHQAEDLDWSHLENDAVKVGSTAESGVDVFSRFEDINLDESSKKEDELFGIGMGLTDERQPSSVHHGYVEFNDDDPFLSVGAREIVQDHVEEDPLDIFGGTPAREVEQVPHENVHSESDVASSTHEYREPETDNASQHSRGNSLPVFDYLDKRSTGEDVEDMQPSKQHQESSSHHHNAGEAMADIGHKAAKALQIGRKWLFNTSKNIARDVQSRIDARASRKKHSRQRSIIDTPKSDFMAEEHHVQWETQLMKVTPEDRMAALAAMEEYDRMAVQQIMDDMVWEDSQVQHQEPPPPPSYDQVIGNEHGESKSVADAPEEDSFDLLDLDGKTTCMDTQWEDDLFGSQKSTLTETDDILQDKSPVKMHSMVDMGQGDEPEIRRKLRGQRLARERERIAQQVASARDKEERDASEKQERVMIRERLRPEIDEWCAGKKDNIRSLLCTMDKVMWEGSGWKSPSVVDIMEPAMVRKWYMKANLVVHPDKVKQKNGTLEQLTRAEMIFDVLKHAWGMFQA